LSLIKNVIKIKINISIKKNPDTGWKSTSLGDGDSVSYASAVKFMMVMFQKNGFYINVS